MRARTTQAPWLLTLSLAVLVTTGLTLMLSSCTGTHARLQRNQEAFDAFRAGKVLPGHTYYTTGMESRPDAILGIADGYTLVTERWKKREMTEGLLRHLVGRMDDESSAVAAGLAGSAVLNNQGEEIGIWYSAVDITVVEMLSDTEVRVSPPTLMQLEKIRPEGKR